MIIKEKTEDFSSVFIDYNFRLTKYFKLEVRLICCNLKGKNSKELKIIICCLLIVLFHPYKTKKLIIIKGL